MEWSLSKVMRIEKGEVNVSPADLRVLLGHLGVIDPFEVKCLLDDARTARSQRWSVDSRHREHLTPALLELMQYEQKASGIRYYSPVLVPGPLQIRPYAVAIFEGTPAGLDQETIDLRIEVRLQRKEKLLLDSDKLKYLVILDESVLYREVGGPQVLADQLQELLNMIEKIGIPIRILPFTAAAPIALLGPFLIVDMGDGQEPVLYREGPKGDEIVEARREITDHRDTFERLWHLAYGDEESAGLIKQRIWELRAAVPRSEAPS
jgi:hypothetical protein